MSRVMKGPFYLLGMAAACGCSSTSSSPADDAAVEASDARDGSASTDWDGESPLFPRCIGDWPEAPEFSLEPSIEGASLEILWTKAFETTWLNPGLALAGERLAFTGARNIYVLDLEGNLIAKTKTAELDLIYSGPSADVEGNFYFSGVRAYQVDNDGSSGWSYSYGENLSDSFETTWARPFVISPDGVAYTAATDGFLYAFTADTGALLWKRDIGLYNGQKPFWVGVGVGDTLLVNNRETSFLYDRDTGEPWATLPTLDGERLALGKVGYSGLVSAMRLTVTPDEILKSFFFLDECGNMQWSLESGHDWYPSVFLSNDSLTVSEREGGSPDSPISVSVFSAGGERLVGPVPGYIPLILGADGVGYSVSCTDGESVLRTLDGQLAELGELSLGSPCWNQPTVLSDSGVLYLSRYRTTEGGEFVTEVLAVQTPSPGLANTSWPALFHDNRQSNWLAPIE